MAMDSLLFVIGIQKKPSNNLGDWVSRESSVQVRKHYAREQACAIPHH
jgi:hypothetical protein